MFLGPTLCRVKVYESDAVEILCKMIDMSNPHVFRNASPKTLRKLVINRTLIARRSIILLNFCEVLKLQGQPMFSIHFHTMSCNQGSKIDYSVSVETLGKLT